MPDSNALYMYMYMYVCVGAEWSMYDVFMQNLIADEIITSNNPFTVKLHVHVVLPQQRLQLLNLYSIHINLCKCEIASEYL